MFCPNCGTKRKGTQAYCKQCGQLMPDMKEAMQRQSKQVRGMVTLTALSIIFGLFSAVALYITYFGGDHKSSIAVAAAFCLVISVYQINNLMVTLKLRRRFGNAGAAAQLDNISEVSAMETGELLPPKPDSISDGPSVTEDTTRQLAPRASESTRWPRNIDTRKS